MLTLMLVGVLTAAFNPQSVETEDICSWAETISITYYFSEPKIQGTWLFNNQIGDRVSVTMEGLPQYRVAGLPVLPFKTTRILLPFGTEFQRVRVTEGKEVLLSGSHLVEWGQRPVPLSYEGSVEPTPRDERVYNSSYPFPGELYSDVSVQRKMGYKILLVNLHPVRFIPKTGKLLYHEGITVEVDVGLEGDSKRLSCRGLPQDREAVKNIVDNREVISTYPLSGDTPTYEYVIITNEVFNATPGPYNFEALRDEKISRGISATIITTEWIYANHNGTRPDGGEDDQTRIHNFIIDAYNNWGTRYVLLGGDGDGGDVGGESGDIIIPHRGFASVSGEIDYDIPADMYYGCLDGTFDYDADGIYGEPGDGLGGGEVDLFAEVYIGRACVDSQTEVQNFVNKTLAYQFPVAPLDLREVWMVGEYLGFGGVADWGGNSKDEIKEGSDAHGYTTTGFENSPYTSQFDVYPLYDRDWPGNNWPKSEIISIINNNIHLLNHLGHAYVGDVMKMINDDVDSLTNEELYFIGYSQGCYCGSFDDRDDYGYYTDYDCISEHLTTEAHGAVAFISNSRYGWGAGYSTDGPSQRYDREFWDAVLGEDIFNIGIANQDSKEDNAGWISEWVMRWCYYQINLFGDPELSIKIEGGVTHDSHEINDEVGGDGDNCPERGEYVEMAVTLSNTHPDIDFTNVTAALYATTMFSEIIFYEDFEGSWPGNWIVGDWESEGGEDYWGDSDYRAYAGSWGAYCADESDVSGQVYDNYMDAYMYRIVDLTGYEIVNLSYYYWLDSEGGYDYLMVGYYDSADSSWHWPKFYTGYIGDWAFDSLAISTTATSVGFIFDSDLSITYEGAYIDEVTLTALSLDPDPYITITDDYEEYGNITAGSTATSSDDYDFEIAADCPEDHVVIFTLEITADNGGPWTDSFEITIASRYSISGQVRDLETGDPLAGATVHHSGPVSGEVSTDVTGNYSITGLVEGTYTKHATALGYSDSDPVEVTLPPDERNNDFELGISDITLTPLKMEAYLLQGESVEKILTVNNNGNFHLIFEIRLSHQGSTTEPYHSGDIIEARWAGVIPTLDGTISAGEWDDAEATDITAVGILNPVTLYVKNTDTHLYIAFEDTNDPSLTYYDQIGIYFDEDHDGEWQSPSSDSEGNFWLGDFGGGGIPSDVIFRSLPDYTEYPNPAGVSGALSDAMGYVVHEAAIEFEVSPLDCAPGDTIGLWVYIYNEETASTDGVWPESAIWDDPSTYGDLVLSAVAPWLSVDPASGTVMPGESMDLTVTFNATGLDVGEYETNIIIECNDPDEPTVIIPARLSVRAIIGDVNGDSKVDDSDLSNLNEAYGSDPSKPNWNPNCDFNNDDIVNALDLFELGKNYGRTT